ncbi:MAG: SHOCT domain-containing protein [Chloroflexota bacterium]
MQGRDAAIIIGAVALVVLVLGFLGAGMMMGPGMMGPWGWTYPGFVASPWWGVLMLVFWGLLIGGAVFLVVWLLRRGSPAAAGPPPGERRDLEILRERYARGEISRDEYEEMRRDLEG